MNERRSMKKVASGLMALTMAAGMLPANVGSFISLSASADEAELVAYVDEEVTADETTAEAVEEVVAVDYSALSEGDYVIEEGDVTVDSVVTVSGVVNLTLNAGATFTASQGIVIEDGAVLNVTAKAHSTQQVLPMRVPTSLVITLSRVL